MGRCLLGNGPLLPLEYILKKAESTNWSDCRNLAEIQQVHILDVLKHCDGNRAQTTKCLVLIVFRCGEK